MSTYSIKMLKDESGTPFVPLASTDSIQSSTGSTLAQMLSTKLESSNIHGGDNTSVRVEGIDCYIDLNLPSALNIINNLTTTSSGQGALDAYQGYILSNKSVIPGGNAGQVLKKSAGTDYALEWGDAADPNTIVGDGTILKIVECTYEQYKAMETAGTLVSTTEYHIADMPANNLSYITRDEIQAMIDTAVLNSKLTIYPIGSIYTSVTSTSPATLFGGTWTQLKDRFLLSAGDTYTNGTTGGEATHTLSVNEMPSHRHDITVDGTIMQLRVGGTSGTSWRALSLEGNTNGTTKADSTGGGQAHNNMPPYLVVYMWKRTA